MPGGTSSSKARIAEIPGLGSVPVESGVVLYTCRVQDCKFETTNPELAGDHSFQENKRESRTSIWRNVIKVVAQPNSAKDPCPFCPTEGYAEDDLRSHLTRKHGKVDKLVDLVLSQRAENLRLTGIAATRTAETRNLTKQLFPFKRQLRRERRRLEAAQ